MFFVSHLQDFVSRHFVFVEIVTQFNAEALVWRLQKMVISNVKCLVKLFFAHYFLNASDFDSEAIYESNVYSCIRSVFRTLQTSKMEPFLKIVNDIQSLAIFAKRPSLRCLTGF